MSELGQPDVAPTARRPVGDDDVRTWLTNMIVHHGFTDADVRRATGLDLHQVREHRARWALQAAPEHRTDSGQIKVMPYPGGVHPRVGFLEGAIDPQREAKVSVFTPWQPASGRGDAVVVDIPEALWGEGELLYLAHTHTASGWPPPGLVMPQLEWRAGEQGGLALERTLPSGVIYRAAVVPRHDRVDLRLQLENQSSIELTQLWAQVCVMVKFARGFDQQTSANTVAQDPFMATHDGTGRRWVIAGWHPSRRTWANPLCPCLHADPAFLDCPPSERVSASGFLSFHEGDDIIGELNRIHAAGWLAPD